MSFWPAVPIVTVVIVAIGWFSSSNASEPRRRDRRTSRPGRHSPRTSAVPPRRILFYDHDQPYYGFTNFSPHPVIYQGKRYPTSEHLFQAFKFLEHNSDLAERIRTISERPRDALEEARRLQKDVRPDWYHVNIAKMHDVLKLKFSQHSTLRDELLSTGDGELVEDSKVDSFWGIGADGKGRNELGKALMRLRDELRSGNVSIPNLPPSSSDDLCIQCHQRPKYGTQPYCGKTCAKAASANLGPSAPSTDLCIHCHKRPRYGTHPYCGKTCAMAASTKPASPSFAPSDDLCIHCHQRPRYGTHPYCGRTCARAARAMDDRPIARG